MVTQSALGLLFPGEYRDADWIKAAWFGNDWITLLVAVPLLVLALGSARHGSRRALLLWLGVLGYAVYNYAFYTFGAALNRFFALYVLALVLAFVTVIVSLPRLDIAGLARAFRPQTPVRLIGACLTAIGACLAVVWLAMWAAYVFAGVSLPIEPEAFKLIAALDLALMVPALMFGGVLLWQRRAWGYVLASMAAIQASLYLVVLSVNSYPAIHRDAAKGEGELVIWGPLTLVTIAISWLLLANVQRRPSGDS
jgi:hypothetical protein